MISGLILTPKADIYSPNVHFNDISTKTKKRNGGSFVGIAFEVPLILSSTDAYSERCKWGPHCFN